MGKGAALAAIVVAVVSLCLIWFNKAANPPTWWYAGFILIALLVIGVPAWALTRSPSRKP